MAENIVIYAGLERIGKLKKKAIEHEAKRFATSVSDMFWKMFKKHGSRELRADLEAADKAVIK